MRRRTRSRLLLALLVVTLTTVTLFILKTRSPPSLGSSPSTTPANPLRTQSSPIATTKHEPRPLSDSAAHPIRKLISEARTEFYDVRARQSKTLKEAVVEYKRRYGIRPPPHFDKWYAFAKERNVQLIDEYDTIHQVLTPFWAFRPSTIRARAREALGFDNNLIGVLIRGGNITRQEGGRPWMQKAIEGMTKQFIQHLPDMDLCFNVHDEPRVIIPHADLERLVRKAREVDMPANLEWIAPRNSFSGRPADLTDGLRIYEVPTTRFNSMAQQATWSQSRSSCPPESAARTLEDLNEKDSQDDVAQYELGDLGFIYNQTAFSDVCNSPSLATTFGLFSGPNAFNVVQDLFPIFSQSKVSSYQDILYPSPWYWAEKVKYDEAKDKSWMEKFNELYWRGSTTGGFSRMGGWRRQHRQGFVTKVNAQENTKTLLNKGDESSPKWEVRDVWRPDFKGVFDVMFTHVGQCDRGDCKAQEEFFTIARAAKPDEAWNWKYLLDIDGNAFSGRFYAFLRSKSLVFKLAIFREWHSEFLKPWVHYIPLSIRGGEWIETMRWFAGEADGKKEGQSMAESSREWAGQAVRNEDLETWFFRLLLEYGRLVDNDREVIGYE